MVNFVSYLDRLGSGRNMCHGENPHENIRVQFLDVT